MAKDANQIVVGSNGSISVAPKGTATPDTLGALAGTYVDLGLVSEDGATFSDTKTLENIGAWQAFGPVRRVVTEKDTTLAFVLRQWNTDTVKLAFGGGEVTEPDPVGEPGTFRYDPPAPQDLDERVCVLDWEDEGNKYRLVLANGIVTEGVETQLTKGAASDLPITIGANHEESGTWYLLTDDPAFDPGA